MFQYLTGGPAGTLYAPTEGLRPLPFHSSLEVRLRRTAWRRIRFAKRYVAVLNPCWLTSIKPYQWPPLAHTNGCPDDFHPAVPTA